MRLCLANPLIAGGGLDQCDLMERFVRCGVRVTIPITAAASTSHHDAAGAAPVTGEHRSGRRLDRPKHCRHRFHHAAGAGRVALGPTTRCRRSRPRAQSLTTHGAPVAVEGCALRAEILIPGDCAGVLRSRSADEALILTNRWRILGRRGLRCH